MISKQSECMFHPFELSFCGYSGSGKTTLITKLIKKFSTNRNVGYIKHDAHHFEMDKEGKDTFLAKKSGACQVAISSNTKSAFISKTVADVYLMREMFIDSDIVFIEGYKNKLSNKILVLSGKDDDMALLKSYQNDEHNLLAIVGELEKSSVNINNQYREIPYFQRDSIKEIYSFIEHYFIKKMNARPLYGLVLGGGKSSRMGIDKGAINYHNCSQVEYVYKLLEKFTEKTFVSCRENQSNDQHIKNFPFIKDRYLGFGPTGGILSAFEKNPDASWLVVACDMPFINESSIETLIKKRNPFKMATCYFNSEKKWPEPLLTIYEPKSKWKMGQYLNMGVSCPRKMLMNSRIEKIEAVDSVILKNINTPIERKELLTERVGVFK